MERTTTRSIRKKKPDRLSTLPDVVLRHILSFLPTKLSVATSALATRYRFLWRDVVNLDFDNFYQHRARNASRIINIINRVMLLSNVRELNSFRLILPDIEFNEEEDDQLLDTWITTTIARNVQTLDIRLNYQVCLPRCLFTSTTLVDLRLHHCGSIPDSIIFIPNLKKLHLDSFLYGSSEKLQTLISGCPVLEELNIQDKYIDVHDMGGFIISSPTIKSLTLNLECSEMDNDGFDYRVDDFIWDYVVGINAPAVRYLSVEGLPSQCFSTGIFHSLIEANIFLCDFGVQDDVTYCDYVLDLLDKVCDVRYLTLLIPIYQSTEDFPFANITTRFINLTKLELTANWIFVFNFLGSADNLQVLIIGEENKD